MIADSGAQTAGSVVLTLGFVVLAVVAYWIPAIVAWRRHVPARAQVVVVNLFLGWTMIGWVVALVMALRQVPPPAAETTPGSLASRHPEHG